MEFLKQLLNSEINQSKNHKNEEMQDFWINGENYYGILEKFYEGIPGIISEDIHSTILKGICGRFSPENFQIKHLGQISIENLN